MQTFRALTASVVAATATFAASAAFAQSGQLITYALDDRALKWSACPEGLPKGCQLAVVNGDPAKPNADVFLKLPGKSKVQLHKHTSAERIILLDGSMRVSYEGMKPATVGKGGYLYGPAGLAHSASCLSAQPCVLFIAFEQPVDFVPVAGETAAGKPAAAPMTTSSEKKPKKGGC